MSNAHHISAPSRPGLPRRIRRRASRTPSPTGASQRRSRASPGLTSCALATIAITTRAEDRGHDRHRERAAARDDAGVEAEAAEQQRAHVDAVEQHHEGRHAGGDVARPPCPSLLQRPRRQRDAAGAGAGEQPRRGVAGERDLGARAQPDPRVPPPVDRDGAEEDRVADEGQRLEHEREREPAEVAGRRASSRRRGDRPARERCTTRPATITALATTSTTICRGETRPRGASGRLGRWRP